MWSSLTFHKHLNPPLRLGSTTGKDLILLALIRVSTLPKNSHSNSVANC